MIADLTKEEKTENLEDKRRLLELLRKRMDFADIQKTYDNWRFSDLVGDSDFKRMYEDQAVKEREKPDSEYFEENIGKYIKLVEEGKEITSRYFGKWKVNFQAYCEEINNNRVLNVNLIHYDKSEPTRISDILQQEKDIKELNIYCNKKHEIYAHRKGKKRYYEFKEGAYYKMISAWPVKDEFGNVSICTMIMNVSSGGITEVLKFNGKDFVPSEEILELIKQNDELYIQSLSLYDAVMKSLEKGKLPDVVPVANNDLQSNESIRVNKDGGQGDLENGASTPSFTDESTQTEETLPDVVPVANSDTSTQMEVDLQQIATQTEINSQQTETQTEVNLQQIATQTEIASQHIGIQTEINSQQITDLQNELGRAKQTIVELKKQNGDLQSESEKAKQTIEKLERQNSDLQDRFGKEEQKNTELQTELAQKNEELAGVLKELQGKAQELKGVYEEKRKLEDKLKGVNTEKKELEDKLKEFEKEIDQAAHIMKEKEQFISNLKCQMLGLKNEYKVQLESYEQEIGKLENMHDEFKEYVASTLESMDEDHVDGLEEEFNELGEIIGDKVWEIEDLKSELQNSKKEKEFFRGQVEELSEEMFADKQKGFNNQFYTLTGDISSEPDNVSLQQRKLLRSSSVPPEEERRLSRSSSFDEGYNSDEENCDNHPCSSVLVLGSVSPIREQARSKSVDR